MKLPIIPVYKLIKVVEKLGFKEIRQKGSHKAYLHPDERILSIPLHTNKDFLLGLLNKIIKNDIRISREEFISILKKV